MISFPVFFKEQLMIDDISVSVLLVLTTAFDKVDHSLLINVMQRHFGARDNAQILSSHTL